MPKTYSAAHDAVDHVARMQAQWHEDLQGVSIACLFAFDSESSLPVLKHQGYPAGAVVRIAPLRDRAMGCLDVSIIIDRANWLTLSAVQRDALIDHELTHLTRATDEDGFSLADSLDRPKLKMRAHDHQFGWFDEIAARHKEASCEVRQARRLLDATGQLYFDFGGTSPAGTTEEPEMSGMGRQIASAAARKARRERPEDVH